MNWIKQRRYWFWLVVAVVVGGGKVTSAQHTATNGQPKPAITNEVSAAPPRPFILPPGQCPVQLFRELLVRSPEERLQLLAARPPATQALLLAKVKEYQALNPEQRELRLSSTELRWYLWPLMSLAPTNRAARLALVPPDLRPGVEERLREWDKLPSGLQNELREQEPSIRHVLELAASSPEQQQQMLSNIPPARRQVLEAGTRQWQALSDGERQKMLALFNQFFELRPKERERTLSTLSDADRRQVERTLQKFVSLDAIRRALCLRAFDKFASLSLEQRQQFLKNAERWSRMTPSERQAWREVVAKWRPYPPRPPGLRRPGSNSLSGTPGPSTASR